ncbi:uncharacterized protein LOC133033350 [Cannabis sativa]|uniref:uncharacterized protein LOC133033350 n=1 Tax=Cannabis sativa TaxID=3483 RepID=UPI0029C9F451|nr:uncharacterized protein LOC133033350 [Cannabis sativa]
MGDQGVNTRTNLPNAPAATTGVNVPANLTAVATAPADAAVLAPLAGGIDQSMLLQALKILEQQRKPIYKLHGTSPFTTKVRQAQLPKGFRLSESLKYKVDQVPQLAKCRILAATLEENAHDWFSQLPEASISTWETFFDLFLTHFQATMTYRPPYTTLANIKQEPVESLQYYFKRFNAEVTKVEKAPESSLVCMLITGVLPRTNFWKELQVRRPESLVEFFAMAESHTRIENSLAELEKGKDKRKSPVPRMRLKELIRRGKFNKYKRNEESHPRGDDKEENQNASGSRTPRNILTMIGGPHIAGDSRKSQERYAKEAKEKPLTNMNNLSERPEKLFKRECDDITFMESDARWVHHPHSDEMVIVANIGGYNVHRILVENGSSVNLLNFQAFKQMGLHENDLRPVTSSIYGFTATSLH